jgi:hypothetical protein
MSFSRWMVLAGALALAGCPNPKASPDAPPPIDAPDVPPVDAPPAPTRVDLSGGTRMTGGALVVDVQLGHPTSQAPATGGTVVVDPATTIKP